MTYRRKLLLKRFLKIAGIVIAVIIIILLFGFTYLSRYLVYTEDGAHFSFWTDQNSSEETLMQTTSAPEAPVLVTGDDIERAAEDDESDTTAIAAKDISGAFIDYTTLSEGTSLSSVDFSDCNTLLLEMRSNGSDILSSAAVKSLISRAQDQGIYLIAMISCLDDSDYALEHAEDALQISGGALWATDSGSYYLNPASENTQQYIAGMIEQLGSMGFYEIVLNNFSFPYSESIDYASDASDRDQTIIDAYENICNLVGNSYSLGILVSNPDEGNQLVDTASHLYVYLSEGSEVETFASEHEGAYLVFLTDSHDTRFDNYGKITTDFSFDGENTPGIEVDADTDTETEDALDADDTADTEDTADLQNEAEYTDYIGEAVNDITE